MSEFTELVRTFAPIILVTAGWYIINRQNDQRETRKELRSLVSEAQQDIDQLIAQAIQFHTDVYNNLESMMIQTRLSRITATAVRLGKTLNIDLKAQCTDFRQSITRHNFDESDHRPKKQNDELIRKIIDDGQALSYQLDNAFQKKYTFR